jgi:S-layer homology domain/Carboxypeptidase regulatory-like domain
LKHFFKLVVLCSFIFGIFFNPLTTNAHNGARDELGGHFRTSDCVYMLHEPTALAKTANTMDELKALITTYNSNATCVEQLNGSTDFEVDLEGYELPSEKMPFTDIKGHWAQNEILFLYELGLVSGYQDGTYGVNNKISRAEVAAIIARDLNLPNSSPSFTDVKQSYWAYNQIGAIEKAKVMSGYVDNTFKPSNSITRAELASLLERAYDLEGTTSIHFEDVPTTHWAHKPISVLVYHDLVSGFGDDTFRPNNELTRAEFAAFLSRVIKSLEEEPEPGLSSIEGQIVHEDGTPVPDAEVTLSSELADVFLTETTDSQGRFFFDVEANQYTLTAVKDGYEGFVDDEFIVENDSIIELTITMLMSEPGSEYEFLELNQPYDTSDNGMTVQMNSMSVIDKQDFVEYHINYTETNNTNREIDQGTFKIYYTDGTSEPQYGFFDKLFPGETATRSYIFKATPDKTTLALEYGADVFFNQEPASNTLKWIYN